ncbi:MAG: homoserine kinase [Bowdeniella nasicola]|nr:homoserine kinase [Bowdeniella nasicola]
MAIRRDHVEISVPATSANLGPGYDCVGMALDLRDRISVRATTGPTEVRVTGEGAGKLPTDDTHLVVRAIRIGLDFAGAPQAGLQLTCRNAIPHGRGLGSSAAAVVAGLMAARAMVDQEEVFGLIHVLQLATEIEGHPDNAAPAIYGGVRLAWTDSGTTQTVALDCDTEQLTTTVVIPDFQLATKKARGVLPETIAHRDAAFNVARAMMFTHALRHPELLLAATEDRLHQPYRRDVLSASMQVVDQLRSRGYPAVISGAGPTVLVFGTLDELTTSALRAQRWRVWNLDIDTGGAKVLA